jgi:hypothetical protein
MSQLGQCTKSLRSSPLRGSKSREAGSQVRGQRWRGGNVNTISSCIVGVQRMIKNSKDHLAGRHPDAASHIDPAVTQWQSCLDEWRKPSLLECAVDISTRKKLIRTMPPNTDRPINRAMVVGCAVSATRNHLKLHEPRTLKILLCNVHAKTRKLWKHSARAASTIEIATNIRSP